ncbi:MAG: ABC transporter permease subunit [Hyphomicrobiales bacterium]|nr:ABC transporter permease subunit [Hyphomicrobiales bacterium]
MIEKSPYLNMATYAVLAFGALMVLLPLWMVFVGASLTVREINTPEIHLVPGTHFFENFMAAWQRGHLGDRLFNSLVMSVGVATGKVVMSAITAFGLVYFRFPGRMLIFWLIFITLMLPLEVRIVPTYAVAANAFWPFQSILETTGIVDLVEYISGLRLALEWNLLNSYTGLILPLIATATGTFLYRQFFLTVPDELLEAARMDGAGPFRFLAEFLLPLSRANMAALFTIMFLYAWNQYLWPLLATPDRAHFGTTAVVELKLLAPTVSTNGGGTPDWNVAMAGCLIVMLPPLIVVALMQRHFIRGLIATEK